jgi:hypothetical protein
MSSWNPHSAEQKKRKYFLPDAIQPANMFYQTVEKKREEKREFNRRFGYHPLVKPYERLKYRSFSIVATEPNHFQMDLVFFGSFPYLVIIGVNNRCGYASPIVDKSTVAIQNALLSLLPSLSSPFIKNPVIKIDADGEKGFAGIHNDFLIPNHIKLSLKPDPFHNRLSLINRLVRTIRDFNYDYITDEEDIPPDELKNILTRYNYYPHRTLSQLVGFYVSPIEVKKDIDLEALIAKKLLQRNGKLRNKEELNVGDKVLRYYAVENPFKKVRFTTDPEVYTIIEKVNGMFGISPSSAETDTVNLIVPGFHLLKL